VGLSPFDYELASGGVRALPARRAHLLGLALEKLRNI
jgi:hypothetical protein